MEYVIGAAVFVGLILLILAIASALQGRGPKEPADWFILCYSCFWKSPTSTMRNAEESFYAHKRKTGCEAGWSYRDPAHQSAKR